MIDLFGMFSPNVIKIFIALEELELSYEFKAVDVLAGQQFEDEFLKLNPNGKVPVIIDRDGPGHTPYTIFESGAILMYLAEKTGRLLPSEPRARFDAIQWLLVQLTAVGPFFGQWWHFKNYAPNENAYSLSRYASHFLQACSAIERRLTASKYIGGDDYSIVDIAHYPYLLNMPEQFPDASHRFPKIVQWLDSVAARPAVVRGLDAAVVCRAQVTDFTSATSENRDRFFKRGKFALDVENQNSRR